MGLFRKREEPNALEILEPNKTVKRYIRSAGGGQVRLYFFDGSMSDVMSKEEFIHSFRNYNWAGKGRMVVHESIPMKLSGRRFVKENVYLDNGTIQHPCFYCPKVVHDLENESLRER